MNLSEVKKVLKGLERLEFQLPNGTLVPSHFHVTEVGQIDKHFIDCGGVVRHEKVVNFQLWNANDYDHRLHPEKLFSIIELSEKVLKIEDAEIEVEYQGQTIEKFGLDFDGQKFFLTTKKTDCLAKDNCGIPSEKLAKPKIKLSQLKELQTVSSGCCQPESGCC
ncbi:MAG: DUF6428 family protein [Saprospiraceae bacterium]